MGKSKRKTKLSSVRHNTWPIPGVGADGLLAINTDAIGGQLMAEIQSKLVSGKPSERHLAADMITSSLANFDDYSDEELSKLIRTLSPICLDRVENCRNASIDALCYLSSISDKLSDLMVSADVLTPIVELFNKYFNDFDCNPKPKSVLISNIYINSCRLLTNLCGTSNKALNIFNRNSNLTKILINCLKNAINANIEVSIASAQCLSVVVEENPVPDLLLPENIELIKNLIQMPIENSSQLHLSNLCAFIAINLSTGTDTSALNTIFPLINQTLSACPLQQINDFAELIAEFVENEKIIELLKEKYFELKNLLLAKRVALELITNITGADDVGADEEYMDCDEDLDDSDEEVDPENCSINGVNESTIGPDLEKILLEQSVLQKVCQHLGSVDTDLRLNLIKHSFGSDVLNCISSVQLCSLTCVHNLVENIANEKLLISEEILKQIYELILDSNMKNIELISETTNTMRAIIGHNPAISLSADQLERLCILCQTFESFAVKVNVINLMSLLAQRSDDLLFIEKIAVLLLTGLQNETDIIIRAEIFDALIDIFSEDYKTDSIALKLDLINRIKGLALVFKKETNKSPIEVKRNPIVSTVKSNLMPFIKYKQKMLNK